MIPTFRSAVVAAAAIPVAMIPAILGAPFWPVWGACAAAIVAAIALDATLVPGRRSLSVAIAAPAMLQIGEEGALSVEVTGPRGLASASTSALAELDPLLEHQRERAAGRGPGSASVTIPLVARRRGLARIEAVWIRLRGPLGLVEKRFRDPVGREVAIVPDLRPVRAAALRSANRQEVLTGSRTMRFVGEGSDFSSLRDFVPGHDHRAISWRASARHRQLLVREFVAERDQQVVIAFDTGRLMSEPLDGLTRLDHAINSGLLLAWSCLKTGDRVGLYSFAAKPEAFRAPAAGVRAFDAIRKWTSGLRYGAEETNYTLALHQLSARLRRRSLVVLMTDFVDVVAARLMLENVAKLAERHLVLFVTLTDPAPRRLVDASPRSIGDVHRAVIAGQLVRERETVLSQLRRMGVHCIDSEPGALQQEVVQRYLWIKRRELL
jgi:uncharacterized protein (DUF58 family)